jgi:murein DD-endopeptidase MepM/ murein hydrolase activator NlpD
MVLSPFECYKYRVTSPYGQRTLNGASQFHGGVDLVGVGGTAVCSVCDGKVVSSTIITDKNNLTWQWGNYVCVDDGKGKRIYYCHLNSRAVKVGDTVKKGQRIGIMGNTGYSFGAHLHFEVRQNNKAINAADYLGIPNKTGSYNVRQMNAEPYVDGIIEKAGFSKPDAVRTALLGVKHDYPDDLYRKIYEKMK